MNKPKKIQKEIKKGEKQARPLVSSELKPESVKAMQASREKHYKKQGVETVFISEKMENGNILLHCWEKEKLPKKTKIELQKTKIELPEIHTE